MGLPPARRLGLSWFLSFFIFVIWQSYHGQWNQWKKRLNRYFLNRSENTLYEREARLPDRRGQVLRPHAAILL